MVEHRNIDFYFSQAAVHEMDGKPYMAVRALSDAFDKVDDLVEKCMVSVRMTDIWNRAHQIGERDKPSASLARSVANLKSRVELIAKERDLKIVFPTPVT